MAVEGILWSQRHSSRTYPGKAIEAYSNDKVYLTFTIEWGSESYI